MNHLFKIISKLCDPAKLYLLLAFISILFYVASMSMANNTLQESDPEQEGIHHYTFMGLVMKVIFTFLWVYILNYLCGFKFGKKLAWIIVLLPFFIMGLIIVSILCAVSVMAMQTQKIKKLENDIGTIKQPLTEDVVPKRPAQGLNQPGQIGFTL